jgi:hypothetical protein
MTSRAFAALLEFARDRPAAEQCDLCAGWLAKTHHHLLDRQMRRLVCACPTCGRILGDEADGRWLSIRPRVHRLGNVQLTAEHWRGLGVPVDLAFFVRERQTGLIVALYPSPAGVITSPVAESAWLAVVAPNPSLGELAPDIEALLINRTGGRRDCYIVSIDECYRLVGLLRRHWRGFSGGAEGRGQITQFFAELDAMEAST